MCLLSSLRVPDIDHEPVMNAVRVPNYQECSRCVMDTTDPQITFDNAGRCCHCNEFLGKRAKHSYQGKESDLALDELCETIKRTGRHKKYDCVRSEEHTSELQSRLHLVCRLLLEKKKKKKKKN